jgi:hypothetical protein
MIGHYFREHPDSYPSDAAIALRLDAETVHDRRFRQNALFA